MSWSQKGIGFVDFDQLVTILEVVGIPHRVIERGEEYLRVDYHEHDCYCVYADEPSSCACCRAECDHLKPLRSVTFVHDGKDFKAWEFIASQIWDSHEPPLIKTALSPRTYFLEVETTIKKVDPE